MDEETIRNILETEFNNNHGVDIVAEASETELGLEIIIEYDLQFIFHFIFQGIQNGLDWKILTEAYRIIFNVYNSCAVKFNKFGIDLLVAKALIFTEVITEENRELKRITEAFHVKCFSRFEKCKIFTSDDLLSLSSICSRCLKDSTYYKMCWFLLYRQSMLPDTFFLWPRIVNMFSEDTFKVLEASSPFAYGVINNLGYEILHCKSSTMARTLMDLALSTLNREIYSTDKYIKLHYTTPLEYLENVVSEPNLGKMLIEDFYFQRQMETTFRDFEQNFSLATEEYRIRNSHVLQGMKNIYSKILIKLLQFHDVRSGILLILESVPQGRRIDTQALGGECELLIALYNSYRKENKEEDRNTGFGLLLGLYDKYFARFNSFFNSLRRFF